MGIKFWSFTFRIFVAELKNWLFFFVIQDHSVVSDKFGAPHFWERTSRRWRLWKNTVARVLAFLHVLKHGPHWGSPRARELWTVTRSFRSLVLFEMSPVLARSLLQVDAMGQGMFCLFSHSAIQCVPLQRESWLGPLTVFVQQSSRKLSLASQPQKCVLCLVSTAAVSLFTKSYTVFLTN